MYYKTKLQYITMKTYHLLPELYVILTLHSFNI